MTSQRKQSEQISKKRTFQLKEYPSKKHLNQISVSKNTVQIKSSETSKSIISETSDQCSLSTSTIKSNLTETHVINVFQELFQ